MKDKFTFTPLIDTLKVSKISDEEYFSSKYSHYISNSRLGNINPDQGGSPEKFFKGFPPIYSDSLILGSAVHTMVLQPEYFELVEVSRPNAKLGYVCDYIYDHKEDHCIDDNIMIEAIQKVGYYTNKPIDKLRSIICTAYEPYAYERTNWKGDKTPMFLSPSLYKNALETVEACNNEWFKKLLHPTGIIKPISENELAFTMDVKCESPNIEPVIMHMKSKLDNFTIDFDSNLITVNDLKTIGSTINHFEGSDGNFSRFHYARELAIYLWLLRFYVAKEYGMTNPKVRANCLVVSTIPGHYTKVYKVSIKEIKEGFEEFRQLMRLVAESMMFEGYDFGRL